MAPFPPPHRARATEENAKHLRIEIRLFMPSAAMQWRKGEADEEAEALSGIRVPMVRTVSRVRSNRSPSAESKLPRPFSQKG